MDIPSLETALQGYLVRGLSGSTQRSYDSAKRKYRKFCNMFTFEPLPLKEAIICFYVTWLAKQNLKYSSIRGYLSALRHSQIMEGHPDPCMDSLFPRLRYVLNGIRRSTANQPVHIRLPITPEILFKLKQVWSSLL